MADKETKSLTMKILPDTHQMLKIISSYESKSLSELIDEMTEERFKKSGYKKPENGK